MAQKLKFFGNMRKIFVVGRSSEHYIQWMKGKLVDTIEQADLVVFTGGEDVDPSLYNEPKNPKTCSNLERDNKEMYAFEEALLHNKHMIGICRGAQFICVTSGGRLIQHQQNPDFKHEISVINPHWDGTRATLQIENILITSTHHQAMYPYDMPKEEYKLLGWTEGISNIHQDGTGKEISDKPFKEAEICYFPKTKALGIQGHPEMMSEKQYPETFEYLHKLLDNHLNNKL